MMNLKGSEKMLTKHIFCNISTRNSALIFYLIALYPFLYLITLILPTNFMQINGETNGLTGQDFYYGVLAAQSQFAVPLILVTYFISFLFYEEYESGRLIFYKDISRTYLYNSKIAALLSMYVIYFILLFIASQVLYFTYIIKFNYASGDFLSSSASINYSDILGIIGIYGITLIAIFFGIMLSMKLSTGFNILGVVILLMIMSAAPLIHGFKYFFPNSYEEANNISEFFTKLVIIILITLVYSIVCYLAGLKMFKRLEY